MNSAHAESIRLKSNLGEIAIPEGWQSEQVSKTHISIWSEDSTSTVDLYQRGFELVSDYLHKRADELRISRYVRSVSREFQNDVNADRGGFILGLTPENSEVAEVFSPAVWEEMDWMMINGVDAQYLFVIAYERRGKLYVMETRTSTSSGNTRIMSDIHRSWILP
ncbi:MAG TPA: hypothetical protein ENH10_01280 [Bacteroidetes bacterium]|nr:hypothetical protein [Bacteroidota bacterium]HEX03777.1 hypothetical protein [Bacteroidota bacterium]